MNNMVVQNYRGIKNITQNTLDFKSFEAIEESISGIELHRIFKKGMNTIDERPAWKQFYELAA